MQVGDTVRVLPPFSQDFPEVYVVSQVIIHDDGQTACILKPPGAGEDEDIGAFDPKFMEAAQ